MKLGIDEWLIKIVQSVYKNVVPGRITLRLSVKSYVI